MTKEITKSIILQEIQDKFKLREFTDAKFLFDETVVPTYDIRQHLQKWRSIETTISIFSSGGKTLKDIPDDEKWAIRAYSIIFISGVYTIAGVYLVRRLRSAATNFSYLDLGAAQSTSYLKTMPEPVIAEPGDSIRVNIDGYTSTGDLTIHIDYMKEEIR